MSAILAATDRAKMARLARELLPRIGVELDDALVPELRSLLILVDPVTGAAELGTTCSRAEAKQVLRDLLAKL